MTCIICNRKSEGKFCNLHEAAYKNLVSNYTVWKKAMKVSWKEYLIEVTANEFSGIWVKEVADYLLNLGALSSPNE